MKTRTMVAATLCLALAAGCKKKDKEQQTGTTTGSAPVAKTNEAPPPPPKPVEPPKPTPKTGKDLAQAFIDCGNLLSGGKFEDFGKQCVAESFVNHEAGEKDMTGAELMPQFQTMRTAFPDMKFEPQLIVVNGRTIIAVVLMTGTNEGPLKTPMGELPATKKKVGALVYERLAMNDENKATERWGIGDPATMMSQLGQLPKGAPPMRPAMDKGMAGAPVIIVAADDDKEKANVAAMKKQNEAFNAKKAADAMAMYADDAMEADQASEKDVKGKKNIEKGLQMFWKAFSDGKIDVPNVWGAGDYVIAEGTFTGTNDGPMDKMPKTGKKVSMQYAEIVKFKDGKIAEVWRFRNGVDMAMQLGLMPMPKPGEPGKGADAGKDAGKGATPPAAEPKK
jgi:steroid delta-isomerase-like uncharacterized protein